MEGPVETGMLPWRGCSGCKSMEYSGPSWDICEAVSAHNVAIRPSFSGQMWHVYRNTG